MIGTVAFINMSTYRASLAGIFRVNERDRHTCQLGFVLDEGRQLTKRPVMQTCSLLTSNSYPPRNSLEYFKGNTASGAFRFLHDCLADLVVNVRLITGLFMANFHQLALGSARAKTLKIAAAVRELATSLLNLLAAECLAVTIGCDIDNSQVDAKIVSNVFGFRRFNITRDEKVKLAVNVAKVGFAAFAFQQLVLAFAAQISHMLATFKHPDAHRLFGSFETEKFLVVREGTIWCESALHSLIKFISIGDFPDGTHSHLCTKREAFPDVAIYKMVKRILAKYLMFPRLFTGVVAGGVGHLKRFEQRIVLVGSGLKFNLRREYHIGYISQKGDRRLLPAPRDGVSAAKNFLHEFDPCPLSGCCE